MAEAPARKPVRCRRCGSADLILHEACLEWAEYDGGLFLTPAGEITAGGEVYRNAGEIQEQLTRIECRSCRHEWHPRRRFIGVVTA